jgi:hypothetical protein
MEWSHFAEASRFDLVGYTSNLVGAEEPVAHLTMVLIDDVVLVKVRVVV